MSDHRFYRVEASPLGYVAVCTCGWHSGPVHSAGLAGALYDQHQEEQ